jgi:hypothetical protein
MTITQNDPPGPTSGPKNQPPIKGGPYPSAANAPRHSPRGTPVEAGSASATPTVSQATAGVLAKKPLEQREPAVVISSVVGVGISLISLAGISLTQDQIDAFEIVIGVLLPILSTLIAGIATRSRVTPTAKLAPPGEKRR